MIRQRYTESDAWKFLTQWQIVFAPAILLGVGYFLIFFSNRFGASKQALKAAFSGAKMTAVTPVGTRLVVCWPEALRRSTTVRGRGPTADRAEPRTS